MSGLLRVLFGTSALTAAGMLALPGVAHAQSCPGTNVYPFTANCPLPSASLNSAIAGRMAIDGSGATMPDVRDNLGFGQVIASSQPPYAASLQGDAQYNSAITVTCTSGNNVVTISGQAFTTSADAGKKITIGLLGASSAPLKTTITSVSGSNVTVVDNCGTSQTGAASYAVWGHDDTVALQVIADAIPATGGTLEFHTGNFLVSSPIALKSHTHVKCVGAPKFYMLNGGGLESNHWIFANENYTASSITDTNISVTGPCEFNGAATTPNSGAHGIRGWFASDFVVDGITCRNLSDCTAFTRVQRGNVKRSLAYNIINTCWDAWNASQDLVYSDNYCETNKHGYQFTGTDSAQTSAGVTKNVEVRGGTVVLLTTAGAGYWFNSGASSDNGAGVDGGRIIGGLVKTSGLAGGTAGIGFKASGSGTKNIRVIGTDFDNARPVTSGTDALATSYPTRVVFDGITVRNIDQASPAVQIHSEYSGIVNSLIHGGAYTYGIQITEKGHQYAMNNIMDTGATGRLVYDATTDPVTGTGKATVIDPLDAKVGFGMVATQAIDVAGAVYATGVVRSTRSSNGQYVQIDGGDASGIYLTGLAPSGTAKSLIIRHFADSGSATAGEMIFQVGTTPSTAVRIGQRRTVMIGGVGSPAHLASTQSVPPALSSCGTTPAISGSDTAGTVTMGTGTPTGCVITFTTPFTNNPRCTVTWRATPLASQSYAVSTAALTLTQTGTSSNVVDYVCVGPNEDNS